MNNTKTALPKKLDEPISIRPLTKDELNFYRENGYVIVRQLFDPEEMELVRAVCQSDPKLKEVFKPVIDNDGKTWGASVWAGLNDSLVSIVTQTARMVSAAEAITGESCYFMYSKIVQKAAYDDAIVY